ncbi:MAG TPA: inositol monophosphatase [Tepidisphaeraceae bacterium]|nr:inositol monophosphatase [Tepidisphaeraceae bacterium]
MDLRHDLQHAVELARGAGRIILDHYGKVDRLTKRGAEAVTEADRASQRFIVSALRKRYPGEGIVGEENETGDAITFDVPDPLGRNWVIDPIDGTNNFVAGLGNFAVSIGLLDAGRPVLGVVYDVSRDLMYAAAKDQGAWLGSRPLKVLATPPGDSALIMLTSSMTDETGRMPAFPMRWFSATNWKIRMLGTAAIEAAQVAAGVAHGAITIAGKLWDAVGPCALVIEAGGIVTDLSGRPVFPFDLRGYTGARVPFIAAGPAAHPVLLKDTAA